MSKKTTIQDVARKAKVSTATVSRVLSNSDYPVSKKLRERVENVAKELNYVPNLLGRELKTNTNNTIGVIIPSISNPFYSALLLGIEESAREYNHHVLLCNTLHDTKLEEVYINTLIQKQIKGLIISSISDRPSLFQKIAEQGIKVVAVDQKINHDHIAQVGFDYRMGGYMATRHLIDNGHRKTAYITAKLNRPSRRSIYQGYLDAMKEEGLAIRKEWVQEAESDDLARDDYEFQNGISLVRRLLSLSELPTAIFCCNDLTAIGVISELNRNGIKIPEDISLFGFDDIPIASMITPSLTTVRQPSLEMGRIACNLLCDMMTDVQLEPGTEIMMQPKIIQRGSVRILSANRTK